MDIVWLLQSSNILTSKVQEQLNALQELGFKFKDYGFIPFTDEITNLENIIQPNTKHIFLGSTKLLTSVLPCNSIYELSPNLYNLGSESQYYLNTLKNGIFYDVNKFDQLYYKDLDLPLLNSDAMYLPVKHNLNVSFSEPKFIKPSRDLKAFNGGILEAGVTIQGYIMNQNHQSFYIDELVVISELVNVGAEYRFFVVNQEVITGSYYRKNGQMFVNNNIPSEVYSVASDYAKLYQPHDVFTLDIAETSEGYKIIEYNCWNSSGSYACDLKKIYTAVHDYVSCN